MAFKHNVAKNGITQVKHSCMFVWFVIWLKTRRKGKVKISICTTYLSCSRCCDFYVVICCFFISTRICEIQSLMSYSLDSTLKTSYGPHRQCKSIAFKHPECCFWESIIYLHYDKKEGGRGKKERKNGRRVRHYCTCFPFGCLLFYKNVTLLLPQQGLVIHGLPFLV